MKSITRYGTSNNSFSSLGIEVNYGNCFFKGLRNLTSLLFMRIFSLLLCRVARMIVVQLLFNFIFIPLTMDIVSLLVLYQKFQTILP